MRPEAGQPTEEAANDPGQGEDTSETSRYTDAPENPEGSNDGKAASESGDAGASNAQACASPADKPEENAGEHEPPSDDIKGTPECPAPDAADSEEGSKPRAINASENQDGSDTPEESGDVDGSSGPGSEKAVEPPTADPSKSQSSAEPPKELEQPVDESAAVSGGSEDTAPTVIVDQGEDENPAGDTGPGDIGEVGVEPDDSRSANSYALELQTEFSSLSLSSIDPDARSSVVQAAEDYGDSDIEPNDEESASPNISCLEIVTKQQPTEEAGASQNAELISSAGPEGKAEGETDLNLSPVSTSSTDASEGNSDASQGEW